jgi:hypothetical protein
MHAAWCALAGLVVLSCRPVGPDGFAEARADEPPARTTTDGVAVVELFTSEGCSSCPPADSLLAHLRGQGPVYALAFHVDYWDDLGWPDRFASAEDTVRQRAYARAFGLQGLYTPQMVVNGVEQFTGSDSARAERSVARALAHPSSVALAIRPRATTAGTVVVDCDVRNAPVDAVTLVAIVERAPSTDVRAGENAGRLLHHANVVRAFAVSPLTEQTASVTVVVPPSMRRDNGEVIAFVQRTGVEGGMPVLAAARAALP